MTRSRLWMIIAIAGCVGILTLGWIFGASPQLDARAAADEQRVSVEAQNATHRVKTIALKKQFDGIDSTRAELAALRDGLPEGVEHADLAEEIASIAARHSVEIVQYAAAEAVSPIALREAIAISEPAPEPAAEPTPPTDATTAADPDAESDATAEALDAARTPDSPPEEVGTTPAASVVTATSSRLTAGNLFAVPVSLSLKGSMADVLAVIAELQSGTRLFLVTGSTVALDESSEVKGYVFVVTGSESAAAPAGTAVEHTTAEAGATVN